VVRPVRHQVERAIFRQASTTYYWSSRFFPRAVRGDVFKLYSFVRIADDYVDARPQQRAKFKALRRSWDAAKTDPHFDTVAVAGEAIEQRVIKNIMAVYTKYAFDPAWVEAFLDAMQADLDGKQYHTLEETLAYTHGSAEVIGLMMAKMLNLSPEAYEAAMLQGRAMQFINFIRDINEDYTLGRCYFPREDLERFGLPDLSPETARTQQAAFRKFVAFQLKRYHRWQSAAEEGFRHIPRRPRIALRTAVDMYNWTGGVIAAHPQVVYERKVKPTKKQVLIQGLRRTFRVYK
jgi:15-cis-phytoene synthase